MPLLEAGLQHVRGLAREAATERSVLLLLGLSSTAMWVQAAIASAQFSDSPAVKAWAIIVGVVSSVLCAFYLLLDNMTLHRLGFAMLVAWCVLHVQPSSRGAAAAARALPLVSVVRCCVSLARSWWCQGIAISFVPSSFISTVNGFVSTWSSVFLAFYFVRLTRAPNDLLPVPSTEPHDDAEPGLGGPTTAYLSADSGGLPLDSNGPRLGPGPSETFRHTPA